MTLKFELNGGLQKKKKKKEKKYVNSADIKLLHLSTTEFIFPPIFFFFLNFHSLFIQTVLATFINRHIYRNYIYFRLYHLCKHEFVTNSQFVPSF